MEREPPNKRLKLNNFAQERILISETFNKIINKVDVDAETIILRINDESRSDRGKIWIIINLFRK